MEADTESAGPILATPADSGLRAGAPLVLRARDTHGRLNRGRETGDSKQAQVLHRGIPV